MSVQTLLWRPQANSHDLQASVIGKKDDSIISLQCFPLHAGVTACTEISNNVKFYLSGFMSPER
eukprot:m.163 g.163  ORF g.163 m.163 type:complete len:64 (+) comp823_c0_seq2:512-703(+)